MFQRVLLEYSVVVVVLFLRWDWSQKAVYLVAPAGRVRLIEPVALSEKRRRKLNRRAFS